jgi:outer membrane receptor protein involved in Fe transport
MNKQLLGKVSLISLPLILFTTSLRAQTPPSSAGSEDKLFELSPFTVTTEGNIGYQATNTLAGSRLNTSLRDVGAAVSVLTAELFLDTGATDSSTILSYALNAETSGPMGNFVGGDGVFTDAKGVNLQNSRVNPQGGQRIRGLAEASLSRNYFETDIAFDTYNVESVTISRGPNSLLFGIGSPGGIIENSLKEAQLYKDTAEVSLRVGQRSSYRGTFDYNKVIVQSRLGIRLAGLQEDEQFKQRPAFNRAKRFYGALKAVVLENNKSPVFGPTIVRSSYEIGDDVGTPPNVTPPGDGISSWFSPPDISNAFDSTTNPSGTTGPFPAWALNGEFVPKYTVDQRGAGVRLNNINGAVAIPYFIQMSLHYTDSQSAPFIPNTDLNGALGRTLYNFRGRPRQRWEAFANASYYSRNYFPGYTVASLPTSVLDNSNILLAGTTNRVEHDFDAQNFVLEQSLFKGKAGFELAFDKQSYATWFRLPFTGGSNSAQNNFGDVIIDINEYLSNDQPNPNVGRMMVSLMGDPISNSEGTSLSGRQEIETDREALRLTVFADFDFREREGKMKWLGRHIVTGLYMNQTRDQLRKGINAYWSSDTIPLNSNNYHFTGTEGLWNTRIQMRSQIYLESSLLDPAIQSIDDVRITRYIDIPIPKAGDVYRMYTYDRIANNIVPGDFTLRNALTSANMDRREIDTMAISIQSYLFNDNLVGLIGWREDDQTSTAQAGTFYLPDGSIDPDQTLVLGPSNPTESGSTFSWSLVGHTPDSLAKHLPGFSVSPHYSVSENFNPVGLRSRILGEPLPSPTGKTREYGFTLNLLEDRLSMRFNWFKTEIRDDSAAISGFASNPQFIVHEFMRRLKESENTGLSIEDAIAAARGPEGVFSSYEDAYSQFISLIPAEVQAVYNFRSEGPNIVDDRLTINNPTPTRNFVSQGFEIEAVANIRTNWRAFINIGKQDTIQSDIGVEQIELANIIRNNLENAPFKDMFDTPSLGEANTYTMRFNNNLYIPLLAATAKEGSLSLELRKWRVNAGTNFEFSEGLLKGVGIGGAVRWQDKVATGYPLVINDLGVPEPDLSRPFWGPTTWNADFWVSYQRNILNDSIVWSLQLNIRNAIGDDDIIPVATNPDGQLAVFRNPNPREIFLTSSFSF